MKSIGTIKEGDKFNMLTAIKYIKDISVENKSNRTKSGISIRHCKIWKFKCDCGNIIEAEQYSVKSGKKESCGCNRSKNLIQRNIDNRKPFGYASRKNLLNKYIYSAKVRNLNFELSEEQFNWLTTQNCTYCGIEPIGLIKAEGKYGEYKYNGIDRVDSKQGYTFDNSVPCCKFCNMAKREYPVEEFLAWIERLKTFNSNTCL